VSTPGLFVSDYIFDRFADALREALPEHVPVVLRGEKVEGDLSCVELAFFSGDLYPDRTRDYVRALVAVPNLRWLHSFSAGVDNVFFQRLIEAGTTVTTSSGANAPAVGHLAVLFLLALARKLPARMQAQREKRWERQRIEDLDGSTVAILGLGPIGLEVARATSALGMHVIGLRRTPRGDEPCETLPLERLPDALARADHLVLALPLTSETHHIIDATALATLRPGAFVVNVGRGELIDEPALVDALRSGRLGGAGLDVFETEPLPEDSPLWDMPNVIVTPHDGGFSAGGRRRAIDIFLDNLGRWARGEPLRNRATLATSPPAA
jgi:phosphoglycerate dehydrogenase-like enzyme